MAKNPGQVGANATWDGPHQPTNLKEGNPKYGMDPMQVLKDPLPYKAGPISSIAKSRLGGGWPDSMVADRSINKTAK
jgi:hypothetical protein